MPETAVRIRYDASNLISFKSTHKVLAVKIEPDECKFRQSPSIFQKFDKNRCQIKAFPARFVHFRRFDIDSTQNFAVSLLRNESFPARSVNKLSGIANVA
jgi:hypothetical protein